MYSIKLQLLLLVIVVVILVQCVTITEPMTLYYQDVQDDCSLITYDSDSISCGQYTGNCFGKTDGESCLVTVDDVNYQGVCHTNENNLYCLTTSSSAYEDTIEQEISNQVEYTLGAGTSNKKYTIKGSSTTTHAPYCEDTCGEISFDNCSSGSNTQCCLCNNALWNGIYTSKYTDDISAYETIGTTTDLQGLFPNISPLEGETLTDNQQVIRLSTTTNGQIIERQNSIRVHIPFSDTLGDYSGTATYTPARGYYFNNYENQYTLSNALYPQHIQGDSDTQTGSSNFYEQCLYQEDSDGSCICPTNYRIHDDDIGNNNPRCVPCEDGMSSTAGRNTECLTCSSRGMITDETTGECLPCNSINLLNRMYENGECVNVDNNIVRSDCIHLDGTRNEACHLGYYHLSNSDDSLNDYYNSCNELNDGNCRVLQSIYNEEGYINYNDLDSTLPSISGETIAGYDLYTNQLCKTLDDETCDSITNCSLKTDTEGNTTCLLDLDQTNSFSTGCIEHKYIRLPDYKENGDYENTLVYDTAQDISCPYNTTKPGYDIPNLGGVTNNENANSRISCVDGRVGSVSGFCFTDSEPMVLTGCVSEDTMNQLTLPKKDDLSDMNENTTLAQQCSELCDNYPEYCDDYGVKYSSNLEIDETDKGCYLNKNSCSGTQTCITHLDDVSVDSTQVGYTCCDQSYLSYPDGSCVSGCNQGIYQDVHCIDCSEIDMVLDENGNCVSECPDGNPYILNNTCVSECGEGYFVNTDNNNCVSGCGLDQFIQGRTCVDQCDSDYFVDNGSCVSSCGPNQFIQDGTCVSECGSDYYVNTDNTCVSSCNLSDIERQTPNGPQRGYCYPADDRSVCNQDDTPYYFLIGRPGGGGGLCMEEPLVNADVYGTCPQGQFVEQEFTSLTETSYQNNSSYQCVSYCQNPYTPYENADTGICEPCSLNYYYYIDSLENVDINSVKECRTLDTSVDERIQFQFGSVVVDAEPRAIVGNCNGGRTKYGSMCISDNFQITIKYFYDGYMLYVYMDDSYDIIKNVIAIYSVDGSTQPFNIPSSSGENPFEFTTTPQYYPSEGEVRNDNGSYSSSNGLIFTTDNDYVLENTDVVVDVGKQILRLEGPSEEDDLHLNLSGIIKLPVTGSPDDQSVISWKIEGIHLNVSALNGASMGEIGNYNLIIQNISDYQGGLETELEGEIDNSGEEVTVCPYDSSPRLNPAGICNNPWGCPDNIINVQDLQYLLANMATSEQRDGEYFVGYPVDSHPAPGCMEDSNGDTVCSEDYGDGFIGIHDLLGLLAAYAMDYNAFPC
jgi:hypothetical protein